MICLSDEQKEKCKAKFCKSALGRLVSNSLRPFSALTGGLLPNSICPTPDQANPRDLQQPADSALGAAARIKQDEAGAKERANAVRYLATVSCKIYPEAEEALINSLRADHNECVRLEAARALGSGCCCTKKTVAALLITVNGTDTDGNPAECSDRVKALAYLALTRCLPCVRDAQPGEQKEKPGSSPAAPNQLGPTPSTPTPTPTTPPQNPNAPGRLTLSSYYRTLDQAQTLADAKAALAAGPKFSQSALALAHGQRDLTSLVSAAVTGTAVVPAVASEAVPAPTTAEPPLLVPQPSAPLPAELPPSGKRSLFEIFQHNRQPARPPLAPPATPAPASPAPQPLLYILPPPSPQAVQNLQPHGR
jgi:hypothetical protein